MLQLLKQYLDPYIFHKKAYNNFRVFLLGFYVMDKQKAKLNCKVERKGLMMFSYLQIQNKIMWHLFLIIPFYSNIFQVI